MRKFAKLIQNEIIKLTKKKSTWIMAILFLVIVVGFLGLCKVSAVMSEREGDWSQGAFMNRAENWRDYYGGMYENSIERDANGNVVSFNAEWRLEYEYWSLITERQVRQDDWLYVSEMYREYCELRLALETGTAGADEAAYRARVETLEGYMEPDGWRLYYEDSLAALRAQGITDGPMVWFYTYSLEKGIVPTSDERYALLESALSAKQTLATLTASVHVSEERLRVAQDAELLATYRLEHNVIRDISTEVKEGSLLMTQSFNFWSVFAMSKMFISIVGVIGIVIAGSIVASEFSQGTYKFLLMSPAKRWKILVAKFATVMLFMLIALAALYLISFLFCLIFFGASELSLPILSVEGGKVVTHSPMLTILGDYLLSVVEIVAMIMLALAISTLVKSNALAISASLVVYFFGSLVEQLFRMLDVEFGRYLLFANLNLPALWSGTEFYAGQSFGFAVTVILCYLVVFGWTAWDAFCRREM